MPFADPACLRPVVAAALASLDSLMPLHSAVAAARLRSCIAADSACWSCLSEGGSFCVLLFALYDWLKAVVVGYISAACSYILCSLVMKCPALLV
jgi:hypothetical protein